MARLITFRVAGSTSQVHIDSEFFAISKFSRNLSSRIDEKATVGGFSVTPAGDNATKVFIEGKYNPIGLSANPRQFTSDWHELLSAMESLKGKEVVMVWGLLSWGRYYCRNVTLDYTHLIGALEDGMGPRIVDWSMELIEIEEDIQFLSSPQVSLIPEEIQQENLV